MRESCLRHPRKPASLIAVLFAVLIVLSGATGTGPLGAGPLVASAATLGSPSFIMAEHSGYDKLVVTWGTDVDGATGYTLQRSLDGGAWETLEKGSATFDKYVDTLENGQRFNYRVHARSAALTGSTVETGVFPMIYATSLKAVATDSGKAVLTWVYPTGEDILQTGYTTVIERKSGNTEWNVVATVGAGTLSHVDTGLGEGTAYQYRIRTDTGLGGTELYWPKSTSVYLVAMLNKPTDFTATLDTQGQAILTWTDSSTQDEGVVIERSIDSGDFAQVATVDAGVRTWTDRSLTNGHVYAWRLRFVNDDADSPYSDEAQIVMSAPENLTIGDIYDTQVNLEWTYPTLDPSWLGLATTVVERRLSGSTLWTVIQEIGPGVEEWRDQTVSADTGYYYRIRGRYESGVYSPYVPSLTGAYAKTVIPLDVSFTGYALSETACRLEWDVTGLAGRKVFVEQMDSSGDFTRIATVATEGFHVLTGLEESSTQTFRFQLYSTAGTTSVYTQPLELLLEAIPSPTSVTAVNSGQNRVSLNWLYPYDSESGFEIWRSTGSRWEKVGETARNIHNWSDTSVPASGSVAWRVRAVRDDNAWSAFIATNAVLRDAPAVPSRLSARQSTIYIDVSWADALTTGASHTLERRSGQNAEWTDWSILSVGSTTARLFLDETDAFDIRMRADRDGVSTWSAVTRFWNALPETPAELRAPVAGSGRVVLFWRDIGEREDGFAVYRTVNGETTRIGETSTGSGANFSRDAGTVSYTDHAPLAGQTALYSVEAFNGTGASNRLSVRVVVPATASFGDLSGVSWARSAIAELAASGVVAGRRTGVFAPAASVTRAEYLKMLMSALGLMPEAVRAPFLLDGGDGLWYTDWVHTAVLHGYGTVGEMDASRFRPDARITRREIALLTTAAAAQAGLSLNAASLEVLSRFSDAESIPQDAQGAIAALASSGILTGNANGRINPLGAATRAEAAVVLYRLIHHGE